MFYPATFINLRLAPWPELEAWMQTLPTERLADLQDTHGKHPGYEPWLPALKQQFPALEVLDRAFGGGDTAWEVRQLAGRVLEGRGAGLVAA